MIEQSLNGQELLNFLLLGLTGITRVLDKLTIKLGLGNFEVVVAVVFLTSDSLKDQVDFFLNSKFFVLLLIVTSISLWLILLSLDLSAKVDLVILIGIDLILLLDTFLEILQLIKVTFFRLGSCLSHFLLENNRIDLGLISLLLLLLDLVLRMQALVNNRLQNWFNIKAAQNFIKGSRELSIFINVG